MPESPTYKIAFIDAGRVVEKTRKGAPTEAWMCSWARRHHARIVCRFYPKYGGWKLIDVRDAREIEIPGKGKIWKGHRRGTRVYPSEDAAVMRAMAILGEQPVLL